MIDILSTYIRKAAAKPLLSREEEQTAARAKDFNELVASNLRLVISIASRYNNKGVPLTDLIQEGNLGLLSAATKFNPDRGVKFSTYATWWIKRMVLKALRDRRRIQEVPQTHDIGVTEEADLDHILAWEIKEQLDLVITRLIKKGHLEERDIAVFKARAYLESTLTEIGEELDLTRQRINQIEKKLYKRLQASKELQELLD